MTITYEQKLDQLIAGIQQLQILGTEITVEACVCQLDLDQDNRKMRKFATEILKFGMSEYDWAIKRKHAASKLGGIYPNNTREYVAIITKRRGTTVEFNGSCNEHNVQYADFSEVMAEMRQEAVELKLPFAMASINDSAEIWFNKAKAERLPALRELIAYDPALQAAGDAALLKIAETCFNEDPKLVVAGFKKFIHQVKGKMHGLPIEKHLMLVLLGEQEGGKSSLVRAMIADLKEAHISIDFQDMADTKIVAMWRNYIGFCDEMVGGNKADNAAIKHAITAATVNRRPMKTNLFITVPQNLTFIGTSNATDFEEIIRDQTGTRRYLGLQCKPLLDWDVVNSTDWLMVWKSIDEKAANPMADFTIEIKAKQETQRQRSRVEVWLETFNPKKTNIGELEVGTRKPVAKLHDAFREFEELRFPGHIKTDLVWFGRQLRAMKNCPFQRTKSNGIWMWNPPEDLAPTEDDTEGAAKPTKVIPMKLKDELL